MTGAQIRSTFLRFFEKRGHSVIPSASLIPENDPTVLFTTAGMHPLVPYLMGETHPQGTRLADAQKCVRTGDIDEVGDNRHLTFFEMLGNWSLGDYFKDDAIAWSFELLTSAQPEGFGLDPKRIYVSVFEGDADAPLDEASIGFWQREFMKAGIDAKLGERIFAYPKGKNWWGPAGLTGPCGPDTEIFYDTLNLPDPKVHSTANWIDAFGCHPNCDCGRYVEIWNNVFMQFNKTTDGKFEPLAKPNVDTGMGLERMAMMLQNAPTVFETDLFRPIIAKIEKLSGKSYENDLPKSNLPNSHVVRAMRIIADHIKAATFILGDQRGVGPSNTDQGYIVRRLTRRAVTFGILELDLNQGFTAEIAETVIGLYGESYPELLANRERVVTELKNEEQKFNKTIARGLSELDKLFGISKFQKARKDEIIGSVAFLDLHSALKPEVANGISYKAAAKKVFNDQGQIPGDKAFYLYETFGFPKELTEEITGVTVDAEGWNQALRAHQDLSRKGAEQKFAGGLADHSEKVIRMHTATHLLHQALRNVLGTHVEQKGSNITQERLRFDFSHGEKMTPEQLKAVEAMVNEQVAKDLPVTFSTMTVDDAKAAGVIGLFDDKYAALGNQVKVYRVGSDTQGYFSKEICGGPHVEHTGLVGAFKIKKEEASSAGIRRIKAVVGE